MCCYKLQETSVLENGEQQHRTYYFHPGTFKPIALNHNGQVYHYHLDHPDTLTNEQGDIAWSVSYRSYGNVALAQVNDIDQPLRFQGQYFDEESGLHYNRFRYCDPRVGLFTQQDPIGLLGGVNNYQYVPNPVHWIDPFGLSCKKGDQTIPENYNILEDRFENAILNLDPSDEAVNSSVEKLAKSRNIAVIHASNIQDIKKCENINFCKSRVGGVIYRRW